MTNDICAQCGGPAPSDDDPTVLDYYTLNHTHLVRVGDEHVFSPETIEDLRFCSSRCLIGYVDEKIAPDAKGDA